MEIQQLRYVLAAAEHRSFTNAATAVHVTQPTLSHAVAKLESELRLELFHRSARGVTPTPAGDIVVEHARRVVAELDDLVTSVPQCTGSLPVTFVSSAPTRSRVPSGTSWRLSGGAIRISR